MSKYKEDKGKVTLCDIMLSRDLPLVEWEDLGELKRERFEKDAWLPVLTIRLRSLLMSGGQSHEDWYNAWSGGIAAFVSARDVYGPLFYQMADLLVIKIAENNVPPYFAEVIKIVIATIHNYTSEEAIFYQYVLTERVKEAWKYWGNMTGADAIGRNITELYNKRESAKERLLLGYTLTKVRKEMSREMPLEVLLKVKNIIGNDWKRQCVTGNHH